MWIKNCRQMACTHSFTGRIFSNFSQKSSDGKTIVGFSLFLCQVVFFRLMTCSILTLWSLLFSLISVVGFWLSTIIYSSIFDTKYYVRTRVRHFDDRASRCNTSLRDICVYKIINDSARSRPLTRRRRRRLFSAFFFFLSYGIL